MRTLALPLGLLLAVSAGCAQAPVDVPVPRPEPLLGMDLRGARSSYIISSHLQTGWAHYLETVPATRMLTGIGNWTVFAETKSPEDIERLFGTLQQYGIGAFRVEVGWGHTEYRADLAEPMRLRPGMDARYRAALRASKELGVRLVVLLNAHQGMPCGTATTRARFLRDAPEGSQSAILRIDDPSIIRVGCSGISALTHYCAAEGLFKTVEHTPAVDERAFAVTLTQPLPKDYPAGTEVTIATLQYRPFGDPETQDATYEGWGEYADLIARIAREEGVDGADIDFEIWNEMTFGTSFLYIGKYDPSIEGKYRSKRMVQVAAEAIREHYPAPTRVINGFPNTSFFFGGFWNSVGSGYANGESYHCYGNQWRSFPSYAESHGDQLTEYGRNVDGFVPAYETLFPEHSGNYIGSHSVITLMQPEMRDQLIAKEQAPEGWARYMTENGIFLNELDPPEPWGSRLRARPEHYVAKYWLRMYPFYLNKGMTAVYDGSIRNPTWDEGSWEARWLETGDDSHLAPLKPLRRLVTVFEGAVDVPEDRLIQLRPKVTQLSGHEKTIFTTDAVRMVTDVPEGVGGDWDLADIEPRPLMYRDVFCLLPFQIDDSTLAIGAYIQTRNIADDITDAGRYRIQLPITGAVTRIYDPLTDRNVDADIDVTPTSVTIELTLTDCPVWIAIGNADGPRGGGAVTAEE